MFECLFFAFKQEIVINHCRSAYSLVCMKLPTCILAKFNFLSNTIMMIYLNTSPFFHLIHLDCIRGK